MRARVHGALLPLGLASAVVTTPARDAHADGDQTHAETYTVSGRGVDVTPAGVGLSGRRAIGADVPVTSGDLVIADIPPAVVTATRLPAPAVMVTATAAMPKAAMKVDAPARQVWERRRPPPPVRSASRSPSLRSSRADVVTRDRTAPAAQLSASSTTRGSQEKAAALARLPRRPRHPGGFGYRPGRALPRRGHDRARLVRGALCNSRRD